MNSDAVLNIENLRVHFKHPQGTLRAVDGVSLRIGAGKCLGVVGESGCGKSATAQSILRLLPQSALSHFSGKILWLGKDILTLPDAELRKVRGAQIAMIFQEPMTALNPVLTVGEQVAEAIRAHFPGEADFEAKVGEIFSKVGLGQGTELYRRYPHELSGGMRQRVLIAIALACRPKLLIADEPTTALDASLQAQILDLIGKSQRELGMAVLLISHDFGVVSKMADEILVLYAGKPVELGPTKRLLEKPLHPYTRALLESAPRLTGNEHRKPLRVIDGSLPDLTQPVRGCSFASRCPLVSDICRAEDPRWEEQEPGHWVSCFNVKA